MKQSELDTVLEILGWSGAELARRAGVSEHTVSRWRVGKIVLPPLASAYLKLAVLLHQKGYRVP